MSKQAHLIELRISENSTLSNILSSLLSNENQSLDNRKYTRIIRYILVNNHFYLDNFLNICSANKSIRTKYQR